MSDHIADGGKMVPDEWIEAALIAWSGDLRYRPDEDHSNLWWQNRLVRMRAALAAVAPMIRAAEMERCHEIAFHEHLAATHDEDDGNTNLVARFKSQGAADGAARIMAAIRAMPKEDA